MSSHHIVREKQEPALLVLGLDTFDTELLGQLLEWSPTVICTPMAAEELSSMGIKVDMILADEVDADQQADVKLVPAGDNTITSALDFLVGQGYPSVNVVTNEFLLDDYPFYADKINLVVFCSNQKIFPVTSGFSKWKPAGESIILLSASAGLKSGGLADEGSGHYRTLADGFYTLHFNEPFLFVAEDIQ